MPRDRDDIPTGKVRRATSTTAALGPSSARLAGSLLASLGRSPERAREVLEERHAEVADHAVEVLGNLRGGAMKLGQLASFVDVEFLPPEFRAIYQEKLGKLRDAAPAMSWEKVRKVLEREWDEPVEDEFESVSQEALAAASIGQVHRGVLKDGREVAIKVQYPEIADALASDLDLASVMIGLGKAIAPGLDPKLIANELRERVLEELDFELEAQQQRTFARAYRGHPFVYVPEVVTALSRRRVLVTEWVSGRRFDEVLRMDQDARDQVGEVLVRFYYGSMARVGRFNTDPHPGNYMLLDDGRMAFLDFGNTVAVGDREVQRRAVMAAVEGDAERFVEAASELGYVRDSHRVDREVLLAQALQVGDWYLHDRELRIDPEYVAGVISALIDPRAMEGALRLIRQLKVPPEEIWLRRVETSVLAVLGRLRATRNWHRIMLELLRGDPPATALGEAEAAFWARRGGAAARPQRP
ncbi:MAG TPA: AarF/ABC1/UbiB kinase family protein [Solirubrobacteraceae bacterium]|nr:AarF/ABC1/UbiB kinase family protein [Solirubrobacteraceae bacterium]